MTTHILALEKDLFFSVKIRDTLQHHDIDVTTVRTLPAFEEKLAVLAKPALAIINTATKGVDWEAAIRAASSQSIHVLAFGSHMDLEARAKALEAGATKVVANSKFTTDMVGLVTRMITNPASINEDTIEQ